MCTGARSAAVSTVRFDLAEESREAPIPRGVERSRGLWISVRLQIQSVCYGEGMSRRHAAVYVRVSSTGQDLASQEPDLSAWIAQHVADDPVRWYRDVSSGANFERPAFDLLARAVAAGHVSRIVVWRLDRLGRTAAQTLAFLAQLDRLGVEFVSIKDGFDATSPTGRLLRTILAGFAEYEREVISQRIRAGIARARASGKRWGGRRPGLRPKLTPARVQMIQTLAASGTPKTEIARQLRLSRSSVYMAMTLEQGNAHDVPLSRSVSVRRSSRRQGARSW